MEVKIYENHWLFKLPIIRGYASITLAPYILFKKKVNEVTLYHEKIHIRQIEEVGWIYFYLSYIFYFVKNLFKYWSWDIAYYKIPYEEEAYRLTKEHFNRKK